MAVKIADIKMSKIAVAENEFQYKDKPVAIQSSSVCSINKFGKIETTDQKMISLCSKIDELNSETENYSPIIHEYRNIKTVRLSTTFDTKYINCENAKLQNGKYRMIFYISDTHEYNSKKYMTPTILKIEYLGETKKDKTKPKFEDDFEFDE